MVKAIIVKFIREENLAIVWLKPKIKRKNIIIEYRENENKNKDED